MEPKAAYDTGQVETPVICPDCASQLGTVIEAGRLAWFAVGGLRLDSAHGRCNCGAPFHWTSGDVRLARLLDKTRKRHHLPNKPKGL